MSDSPERVSIETQPPSQEVLEALQALIPGAVSDGVIDAQRIGEAAGLPVAGIKDGAERFGLMWAGKSKAVEALQAPSMAALAPDMENSVNWDTAENVFIEGDNLEVLKLLQKAYNDQVKLIYIDPPYNTGNDFVYNDDFSQPLKHYLEVTGQVDAEGNRLVANTEVSGRKHSNWLSMMYPRLVLARNLLTEDGLIFVSISDHEVNNLMSVMEEIFGRDNFIANLIWDKGHSAQAGIFKVYHEYVMVFARDASHIGTPVSLDADLFEAGAMKRESSRHPSTDFDFPAGVRFSASDGTEFTGTWGGVEKVQLMSGKMICENGVTKHPVTLRAAWTQKNQMQKFFADRTDEILDSRGQKVKEFYFNSSGKIKIVKERGVASPDTTLGECGTQAQASSALAQIFGTEVAPFDSPKPVKLISDLITWFTSENDIVLDFFAGSGTTGEAVQQVNQLTNRNLKFVLVNLDENVNETSAGYSLGFRKISEITRKRLRIIFANQDDSLLSNGGMRCFKLNKSAFVGERNSELLFEGTLHEGVTNEDVVSEILLKNGVRLDQPWNWIELVGSPAAVSDGVCVVLARELNDEIVEAAKEMIDAHTVIFLEDSFAGRDAVKANAVLGFKQVNKTMKTI